MASIVDRLRYARQGDIDVFVWAANTFVWFRMHSGVLFSAKKKKLPHQEEETPFNRYGAYTSPSRSLSRCLHLRPAHVKKPPKLGARRKATSTERFRKTHPPPPPVHPDRFRPTQPYIDSYLKPLVCVYMHACPSSPTRCPNIYACRHGWMWT